MSVKIGLGVVGASVAALAACSSPAEGPAQPLAGAAGASGAGSGAGVGGSTASGGSVSADGGVGGSGAAGTSGSGGAAPRERYGQVVVQYMFSTSGSRTLSASFTNVAPSPGRTCTSQALGACSVSLCTPASDAAPSGAKPPTAGTISFSSLDKTGGASIMPDADGIYTRATLGFEPGLSGGERGSINATGAEIPAFEAELNVPLVLLLSTPVLPADQGLPSASRTETLSVAWTRGEPDVSFLIQGSASTRLDGMPGTTSISCSFESLAGSGNIDVSLLSQVPTGVQLNLFTARVKSVQAGDYAVTLGYVTSVANPDKKVFPNIELE